METFTLTAVKTPDDYDWRVDAACRNHDNPDIFFTAQFYEEAKAICADCPVRLECLAEGIANDKTRNHGGIHGVWGGVTPDERHPRKEKKEVALCLYP